MATETAFYRGEGGVVWEMDLPLSEVMQEKVVKGTLRRVDADGMPYVEASEPDEGGSDLTNGVPPRPPQSAGKAEWVGYAVLVGEMTVDDADAMTKADLIDKFGGD